MINFLLIVGGVALAYLPKVLDDMGVIDDPEATIPADQDVKVSIDDIFTDDD